jgi:glycyl-tRNA synthetase
VRGVSNRRGGPGYLPLPPRRLFRPSHRFPMRLALLRPLRSYPRRPPPFTRLYSTQLTETMSTTVVNKTAHAFDKTRLDGLLNRRFFYAPAFEIYGGVAGLYDYGPPGSALQANILAEWRRHFIVEENMLGVDTTCMTPAPVFEASGHVARFADWMVKDTKTGDVLRADHLVKGVLQARLDGDRAARGLAAAPLAEEDKKRKKKKDAKAAPVRLADEVVAEYESVLAQVRRAACDAAGSR